MIEFCLTNRQKSSSRFKALAAKYEVSDTYLENAIYAWGKQSDKDSLPEDFLDSSEVESFLDDYFKLSEVEYSSEKDYQKAKSAWDTLDNGTNVRKTKKAAMDNLTTLQAFFGKENVSINQTPEGAYIIRVAKPVLKKSEKYLDKHGFLTKEGEELFGSTFKKEDFPEGTVSVNFYPETDGRTAIKIGFKHPKTGQILYAIYFGNDNRLLFDLYEANGNTVNVQGIETTKELNEKVLKGKIVPNWLYDLVHSGQYTELNNTPRVINKNTQIVEQTELEYLLESKYNIFKEGRSSVYNNKQLEKIKNLSTSDTSNSPKVKTTPKRKTYIGTITSLKDNQVFVFGSNTQGRHGAGAALTARQKFGAKYRQAEGIQGQSFAIITKDLTKDDKKNPSRTPEQIKEQIKKLYDYAMAHLEQEFLVAYSATGKNLNYYTPQQMAQIFAETSDTIPSNIVFEKGFNELVESVFNTKQAKEKTVSSTKEEPTEISTDTGSKTKTPDNPAVQRAIKVVDRLKEQSKRISFDKNTHQYRVYESEEDKNADKTGRKGIKAISVSKTLYPESKDLGKWGTPSSHLGNTADEVTRDFFAGRLNKSYPNLTSTQLANLVEDLEALKAYFAQKYGKDYIVITDEFPIAAKQSDGSYIAGTMDMMIIDSDGNIHILDMKAKRSGMSASDLVNYGNQTSIYQSIVETSITKEDNVKVAGRELIQFTVPYPAPSVWNEETSSWEDTGIDYSSKTTNTKTDQLYIIDETGEEVKIQNSTIEDFKGIRYNGIRLVFGPKNQIVSSKRRAATLVDVSGQTYQIELEALDAYTESEEKVEPLPGENEEASSMSYTSPTTDSHRNTLYSNGLLSASEISFLSNQAMQLTSYIITHLQQSTEASSVYFKNLFAGHDFTKMSREEIINTIGVKRILSRVKDLYFKPENRLDILDSNDDEELTMLSLDKLQLAYDNFDALVEAGYAKLITLEGVTVEDAHIEDLILEMGDESINEANDSSQLEEKEREYWQLGQRHISAKSSLSAAIRRMFERLKVLDEKGNPVKDSFGFNMDTFVDAGTAVNSILEWVSDCTTIEEMEKVLETKAASHPYLHTILDKIKEEPIRSQFFQNFRKDFTTYSIIRVEEKDGKKRFVVQVINTKGAISTMLSNLSIAFNSGLMQNLIVTRNTVEGKGKVNTIEVAKYKEQRAKIVKAINTTFGKKGFKATLDSQSVQITKLLNNLGIQVSEKVVKETLAADAKAKTVGSTQAIKILEQVDYILKVLEKNKDKTDYNPFAKAERAEKPDLEKESGNVYSNYKSILNILAKNMEDSIESSSYENGKMHYSFVTPSYMGKLVTNLKDALGAVAGNEKGEKFKKFLEDNYTKYRWFYEQNQTGGDPYNNEWLRLLATDPSWRQTFEHKVQLSYDKTAYRDLSELGYTLSLMKEYFADPNKRWAWYRIPILSNKPSSEFLRFKRYSGKNYKDELRKGFKKVFHQEILRIKTVMERASVEGIEKIGVKDKVTYDIQDKVFNKYPKLKAKLPKVKNGRTVPGTLTFADIIDKNGNFVFAGSGAEFKFLDALNNEFVNKTELGQLILDKINGKNIDESKLDELLLGSTKINPKTHRKEHTNGAIDNYMNQIVQSEIAQWESIGLFETEEKKKGEKIYKYVGDLGKTREEIEKNLEEYIWNDTFATINIIELTATDLAYYRNMEDFQKRYAQVHSPTLRLNTTAEWNGQRVSKDGISRTLYLSDYSIKSDIIPNVRAIFDAKIASIVDPVERENMKKMRDLILPGFEKINVADAQGYSSPTSYRKKMVMAGKWDDTMEEAYTRIRSGNYNVADLGIVWQPLKPFVYSQISKTSGAATMSEIKVPVQNKNSEYMLLLADALMRSSNQTSKLTAIFDFMEDSAYDGRDIKNGKSGTYNGIGIDTVQFISAVNSGAMGAIDINEFDDLNVSTNKKVALIKAKLNKLAYYNSDKTESADNANSRYNDQYVHEIPFDDYGIQQEVPAHLTDHEQLMGSQMRILSISDISDDPNIKFNVRGYRHLMDKDPLIERYQKLIADNIKESFEVLMRDLDITRKRNETNDDYRKRRNEALSKLLKEAIRKDQRYGADLLRACSLDSNGEFIIPISDPVQSMRVQQLLNSIIKSRINKQKIQGGPVVQASVFGMSDDLHIIFVDKDGKELRTKKKNETDAAYKKYLDENQATLKGMEVYMPIPSKEMEKALTKSDGTLMSIEEALEKEIIDPEMLKAIGYRIPTEDKYSMMPMLVKGFLPRAAGEAIMMPKEVTLLTGSDFDIDKMYIMLKAFNLKTSYESTLKNALIKTIGKNNLSGSNNTTFEIVYNALIQGEKNNKYDNKQLADLITKAFNALAPKYKKVTFTEPNTSKGDKATRQSRNNEIFDIQWSVLTHPDTLNKMFNPGSFDVQKRSARIVNILKARVKNPKTNKPYTYSELEKLPLNNDVDKDASLTLEDLAESATKRNIIHSTTQVYFHKQNMTAGKLIGIFANNNTSHAFCSLHHIHWNMQDYINGELQESSFTINGHTVDSIQNNELDRLKAFDGALISKNIAGFLAASVDAVKDPVLSYMNINNVTAGPAMVLARLGFDSDSIGLLMSQPIIEKISREYFKRNNEKYTSINDVLQETLEENWGDIYTAAQENLGSTDFSKDILAKGISLGSSTTRDQMYALLLFQKLSNMAQDMNTLTFLTKFNSVTNAVGPSIADTLVMRERYNKFLDAMSGDKPPFSPNAAKIISVTPILNAFFGTTVGDTGASRAIFENYFPHYSATVTALIDRLRATTKANLDATTINKLINDFIYYKLTLDTGEGPVINASLGQRNRFINKFVSEFNERAKGLVDNELIKIITFEKTPKCPVVTLSAKTGGYSIDVQEKIKNAWSELMSKPETFKLGRDLFIYNLYRSGFTFSPKTFLHLASTDTKLALPKYIEAISDPEFNDYLVNIEEFLLQFRRNHANNSKIVPELSQSKHLKFSTSNKVLTIKFNKKKQGLSSILVGTGRDEVAPVIKVKDKLYFAENTSIKGTDSISYIEIEPLGNPNNFLEYNAMEDAVTMKSALLLPRSNRQNATSTQESSTDTEDISQDSGKEDYTEDINRDSKTLSPKELKVVYEATKKLFPTQVGKVRGFLEKQDSSEKWKDKMAELLDTLVKTAEKKKIVIDKLEEIYKLFCK